MRTSPSSTGKGVSYYWNEIKTLSPKEKLQIITLLSSSLMDESDSSAKSKEYTKEILDRFGGAWTGDETAEEIIDNINKSKRSHLSRIEGIQSENWLAE